MADTNEKSAQPKKSVKRKKTAKGRKPAKTKQNKKRSSVSNRQADYPRYSVRRAMRIPIGILEQNAGHACSDKESAQYCGIGYNGRYQTELGASVKYGFLDRPETGMVAITDLARGIMRPKSEGDETDGLRRAILNAPQLSEVYKHYRGENLPDEPFFSNTLADGFGIPLDKVEEFKAILEESLVDAKLVEKHGGKSRVLDVSQGEGVTVEAKESFERLEKSAKVKKGDSCFVMMPFASPTGDYFKKIYEPAIKNAGLRAVRADDDMFATGKIIDQIWTGIHAATVLVAELTGRNPNVFYELGLAHALKKPVVLVSSNEDDVPFDVQHIRVIYYDVTDPFWGEKLIAKIGENVLSAISNPQEATLKSPPSE